MDNVRLIAHRQYHARPSVDPDEQHAGMRLQEREVAEIERRVGRGLEIEDNDGWRMCLQGLRGGGERSLNLDNVNVQLGL